MGDWLGTLKKYRSFTKARTFVRRLKLKSNQEWRKYRKGELPGKKPMPLYIPSNPDYFYKNKGWVSWGDWLGTGSTSTQLRKGR